MIPESVLNPARPHLFGMTVPEVIAHLGAHGIAATERDARRLLAHLVSAGRQDLDLVKPVKREILRSVDTLFDRQRLELVDRVADPFDNFVKYLFRSPDGALTEAVRIPLHKEGRFSVCLSSQVGCAMRCDFCATGRLGLTRNLAAWEMVAAFVAVRDEAPGRVSGAVFQGQGEPFHNYDEVIRAASILCDPCGGRISAQAITISTVGLVPQIHRYASEGHRFRLIVSLTSAIAERRRGLLPVAGRFSMDEVKGALRAYAESTGKRATVAWVLMGGVNHGEDELEALRELAREVPIRVNLIDVNVAADVRREADASPRSRTSEATSTSTPQACAVNDAREGGYRVATDDERSALLDGLEAASIPFIRRYSGGKNRHAACGMLAAQHASS